MKKLIILILFFTALSINGQIKKDDLAHIEAGAVLYSAAYFGSSALQFSPTLRIIIPFMVVNAVGSGKEFMDMAEPNNYFSWGDMAYNNLGAVASLLLIEGGKALGIPDRIIVGMVLTTALVSFGLTVNF